MLKEFLTATGIAKLIDRIRIGGLTVRDTLKTNRDNTKFQLKQLWKRAVRGEWEASTFAIELDKVIKTRERETLTTLKGVMLATRGEARAILAPRGGYWISRGVLDGSTTPICTRLRGARYDVPYSQISDKPPRSPPPHRCRSFLTHHEDGSQPPAEESFEQAWRGNDELQKELLGPKRYEAYKAGAFGRIETYAQYEKAILVPVSELDI